MRQHDVRYAAFMARHHGLRYLCIPVREAGEKQNLQAGLRDRCAKWKNGVLVFGRDFVRAAIDCLPMRARKQIRYFKRHGRFIDWKHPKALTEKISAAMLTEKFEKYTELVDKLAVRRLVEEKTGKEHLVNLYGAYHDYREIREEDLPNRCVLKMNDGCGTVLYYDRKYLNFAPILESLQQWHGKNYYEELGERQYKNIVPRILVEEDINLRDADYQIYRAYCCKGQIQFIDINDMHQNIWQVDRDLNEAAVRRIGRKNSGVLDKPAFYNELRQAIETLASDFEFVRVDMYVVKDGFLFNELTFSPSGGNFTIEPEEYDYILGEMIDYDRL